MEAVLSPNAGLRLPHIVYALGGTSPSGTDSLFSLVHLKTKLERPYMVGQTKGRSLSPHWKLH